MYVYCVVQLGKHVHMGRCLKVADALQAHLLFYPVPNLLICLYVYGNKHQLN